MNLNLFPRFSASRLSTHSSRQLRQSSCDELRQSDVDASSSNVDVVHAALSRDVVLNLPLFAAFRTSGREIAGTFVGTSTIFYRGTSLHSRHFRHGGRSHVVRDGLPERHLFNLVSIAILQHSN